MAGAINVWESIIKPSANRLMARLRTGMNDDASTIGLNDWTNDAV